MTNQYVLLFTDASSTGYAYTLDLNKNDAQALLILTQCYNKQSRWQKRNCDGSARFNTLRAAIIEEEGGNAA